MKRPATVPTFPAFIVLIVRGLALYLLIPLAFIFWLLAFFWISKYSKSLPQFVTWVDYNFSVSLIRGPLRALIPEPRAEWLPLRRIKGMTARTKLYDLL
jgi:hypothetical protein